MHNYALLSMSLGPVLVDVNHYVVVLFYLIVVFH